MVANAMFIRVLIARSFSSVSLHTKSSSHFCLIKFLSDADFYRVCEGNLYSLQRNKLCNILLEPLNILDCHKQTFRVASSVQPFCVVFFSNSFDYTV